MFRTSFTLVHKELIAEHVYILAFKYSNPEVFEPGSIVTFEVEPKTFRSYSYIYQGSNAPSFVPALPNLEGDERYVVLLVSTKVGGIASHLFEKSEVGLVLPGVGPAGKFRVEDTQGVVKNFICTGTGLAPFIPMIHRVFEKEENAHVRLFFGTSYDLNDFSTHFFADVTTRIFEHFSCMFPVEIPVPTATTVNGTVTQVFPSKVQDFAQEEFYLCGNPFMIKDVTELLQQRGATKVYTEVYGALPKPKAE